LRDYLRQISPYERHKACGRTRIAPTVQVVRHRDGRGGLRGLATCASVWACPVCAPRIAAERAEELKRAVRWSLERELDCYLLTATVRHAWSDDPRVMFRGLAGAWRRLTRGAPWKRWTERVGLRHWIRGAEATHGPNGWHPHLHVLLFVEREATTVYPDGFAEAPIADAESDDWLGERWIACVTRELGSACAPSLEHGLDVRRASTADYLAKLGLELVGTNTKQPASGHRTPWQIAYAARDGGAEADVRLFRGFAAATYGRRQLTWSRGLRKLVELERPEDDRELVDELEGELAEVLGAVEASTWRTAWPRAVELVEAAELGRDRVISLLLELDRQARAEAEAGGP
jgi:hypothetical protein